MASDEALEVLEQGPWRILDRQSLKEMPRALSGWQLVGLLRQTGPVRADWVTGILDTVQSTDSGQQFDLGSGRRAVVTAEAVFLGPESEELPEPKGVPLCRLPAEGQTLQLWDDPDLGGWQLRVRELDYNPGKPKSLVSAVFDSALLKRPLRLMNPEPGMRIRLHGAMGRKKISDLLIDRKLPQPWRRNVVLLLDARDQVLWIPGLGRSRHALVSSKTKSCLSLDLERASS